MAIDAIDASKPGACTGVNGTNGRLHGRARLIMVVHGRTEGRCHRLTSLLVTVGSCGAGVHTLSTTYLNCDRTQCTAVKRASRSDPAPADPRGRACRRPQAVRVRDACAPCMHAARIEPPNQSVNPPTSYVPGWSGKMTTASVSALILWSLTPLDQLLKLPASIPHA